MSELVTLSKSSPQFESYLLGTFAKDQRALPLQTLNVNSAAETVTFRVVPLSRVQKPSAFFIVLKTFKARSFFLILVPLLLVLTKNVADATAVDPFVMLLTMVGSVLAFMAANLRNDYVDHMKGIDRVLEQSGSRAIQNGWVTAAQVKFYSSLLLLIAILCAVPLVIVMPSLTVVVALALAVGMWAQFKKKNSFKYRIGGELAVFLMVGPLFTVGCQMALAGRFDWESFWLGCVWGWAVVFMVHLRNFVNILPSVQAGFSNTVNWLGFDKSRRLLAVWWGLFIAFNALYHWNYSGFYWGIASTILLSASAVNFVIKLKNLSSPIGSDMRGIFNSGFYLFLLAIGLWVFECLWYLLT